MTPSFEPPRIREPFLNAVPSRRKIDWLLGKLGCSRFLSPFRKDGALNRRYLRHFVERYNIEQYFEPGEHARYMKPFPLYDRHRGKKFIVFGTGPSFTGFDFSRVSAGSVTIGANLTSEFYHCDYVFMSNPACLLVAPEFLDFSKTTLLLGSNLWNGRTRLELWKGVDLKNIVPVDVEIHQSWDISQGYLLGHGPITAPTCIDIALLMGASSILVIGADGYKGKSWMQVYGDSKGAWLTRFSHGSKKGMKYHDSLMHKREAEHEEKYLLRQAYCEKVGVPLGFWGPHFTYGMLNRVRDQELSGWL